MMEAFLLLVRSRVVYIYVRQEKPLFMAYKARLVARIQLVQRRENEIVTRGNSDRRQLRLQ